MSLYIRHIVHGVQIILISDHGHFEEDIYVGKLNTAPVKLVTAVVTYDVWST